MKNRFLLLFALLMLGLALCLSACKEEQHIHAFTEWSVESAPSCLEGGKMTRACSTCGACEQAEIPAVGHIAVHEVTQPATCTTDGRAARTYCGVCQVTLEEGGVLPSTGHTPVTDAAVAATCTAEGRTEGSHCATCSAVLVPQCIVAAKGHTDDAGRVLQEATCVRQGTKLYTCTANCGYSHTASYTMPTYTANELYEQSLLYVGEITVYDIGGNAYGQGSGFVISADGRIVTNYHVIEGAYSATVQIGESTYNIVSVLGYDADIDLAVVKINATGLPFAKLCDAPVRVGDTVYAVGSPRGMTNTFSAGIVTYADRVVDGVSHVQHDVSITHGNSGGPLLNVYGEVIGVNTWGMTDSQNLNFAVAASELAHIACDKPLGMEEFYVASTTPYDRLCNWLFVYYNLYNEEQYTIRYGEFDAYNNYYALAYDLQYGVLCLVGSWMLDNGDVMAVSIVLAPDTADLVYVGQYSNNAGELNTTDGTIYAPTFTAGSALTYQSTSGGNWDQADLMNLYQQGAVLALQWFSQMAEYNQIGVTLPDMGFAAFE